MKLLLRWCRFNAVGALGMAVQLLALTLLDRWSGGRHLFASVLATEVALLHNFVLHLHFTWPEPTHRSLTLVRLVRFHLSNGLVSLIGNFAVVWVLTLNHRVALTAANLIAIAGCSLLNFGLASTWTFRGQHPPALPLQNSQPGR